jgi:hypothetical protein
MNYYESHFDDYIIKNNAFNLHPELDNIKKTILNNKNLSTNLLLYGPMGVGKYTQALSILKLVSPSKLKYEKKLTIVSNKVEYFIKISDIHFEIDMALLGCNSKILWHEIYNQIVDIIFTKNNKQGIILCKNFQDVHSELLDIFYSYIQKNNFSIKLYFMIITNEISFIPTNILNACKIINISRPTKKMYSKCSKHIIANKIPDNINNIKYLYSENRSTNLTIPYKIICNKIISIITNINTLNYSKLRECLYDILIYNLDIGNCIYYIIDQLVKENFINSSDKLSKILIDMYIFLKYYNNNYRPIYHLEKYFLTIVTHIQ